jgi:hypothetical protein
MTGKTGSYYELISDVTDKELQWVGKETEAEDIPTRALYTEAVRRVQVWTFRWMAESLPRTDPMRDMFDQLADGLAAVPDIDLWIGEPGASGGMA